MQLNIIRSEVYNPLAARKILSFIEQRLANHNSFTLCLATDDTSCEVYLAISQLYSEFNIDWNRVFIFWGDETIYFNVDKEAHVDKVQKSLLDHLPIPVQNIFPFRRDLRIELAAEDYEEKLKNHFDVLSTKGFDLVIADIGPLGDTLGIFPKSYATRTRGKWVFGYRTLDKTAHRLTCLPDVINHAHQVIFLVKGAEKATIIKNVLHSRYNPELYPSQLIQPTNGNICWLIDESAGSLVAPKQKFESATVS